MPPTWTQPQKCTEKRKMCQPFSTRGRRRDNPNNTTTRPKEQKAGTSLLPLTFFCFHKIKTTTLEERTSSLFLKRQQR